MRVGVRIPPCAPVTEVVAAAVQAERLGFDEVWFPDSQLLWRDVFTVAATAAAVTSRVTLGIAVSTVATRHPSVLASAARTVGEVARDRFVLGLGVGNSAVAPVGLRASTGAELRAGLGTVRALLAGEGVDFGGVTSSLRDPVPVPLHIAASGPRNLRLAGEIADGVILLSGISTTTLGSATAKVREGAESAGRDMPVTTVSAYCKVTDDVERDARELKPVCAGIAQNGGVPFLALAGVHVDVPPWSLPGVYPDMVHAEGWDAAVRACDPYISDEAVTAFAREFCLFGSGEEILYRLETVRAAGADAVFLQHVGSYDLPYPLLNDVAGKVLSRL
jgi:5,10-methylenetetrahydromethanopterin reductase